MVYRAQIMNLMLQVNRRKVYDKITKNTLELDSHIRI